MTESHSPSMVTGSGGLRPNLPEYTVSELSQAVKRALETDFGHVRVRGEISGFKRVASGHCYLTLKDAESNLDGVIWRTAFGRLAVKPEDGMDVVCIGRMTTYPGRSKYQLIIEAIELAGVGALLKLLEERKKKLAAEGLFDDAHKRKLPYLPDVIGVVTSPTGAVIRDILHRLSDRFPRRVLVWPVPVQGEGAAEAIAAAITGFDALDGAGAVPRPDLLIVARGGGSLEDLMAFNEEVVVRAAASCTIPLISAVGHETDTTLIDFAADRRAPTPTAAAEMAVPVRLELVADVAAFAHRLAQALVRFIGDKFVRVEGLARGLPDPRSLLETALQRLDDRSERLRLGIAALLRLRGQSVQALGRMLRRDILEREVGRLRDGVANLAERLAPAAARLMQQREIALAGAAGRLASWRQAQNKVLERGYVLVRDAKGAVLTSAHAVVPGADLALEFHDGKVAARAIGREADKPARPPAPKREQGKLL
ncbi:MAG: exodeoxyribonuclease VII large subunit [Alphaproteobacteria bacterium]|nr:exodeoxyribonuclease VII large subunit [Alphaproteobacteria bacterium]